MKREIEERVLLFVILLFKVFQRNCLDLLRLSFNKRSRIGTNLWVRLLHEAFDQVVLKQLLILGNRSIHELLVIFDACLNLLNEHWHQLVTNILVGQ